MRTKLILLATIIAAAIVGTVAIAENIRDRAASSTPSRTEADVQRVESPAGVEAVRGEKVPTVLAPEYAQLKEQYRTQIDALQAQLAMSQSEEDESSLQEQIMAVKHSYKVARLNLALEQARASGSSEAESRILEALANLTTRPVRAPAETPRDPETGKEIMGGAR